MKNLEGFEKIIAQKRSKSSDRKPSYAMRKLSIGLVSCMMGYLVTFSPGVYASEVAPESVVEEKLETKEEASEEEKKEEASEKPAAEEKAQPLSLEETEKQENPEEKTEESQEEKNEEEKSEEEIKLKAKEGEKVNLGESIDPKSLIAGAEDLEGASFAFKEEVDTSKPGIINAVVVVSQEGKTQEIPVSFEVVEKIENDDKAEEADKLELAELGEKEAQGQAQDEAKETTDEEIEVSDEIDPSNQKAGENSSKADLPENIKTDVNWDEEAKKSSRWMLEDDQKLVKVGTSDVIRMNDIAYDGAFLDGEGRTVIRLLYKEHAKTNVTIWYRAMLNLGELDQFIDYDKSYFMNHTGTKRYNLEPAYNRKYRTLDTGETTYRTASRVNLPINLVLKEGITLKDLGDKNYIVQMRVTDNKLKRVYAYAPGKSSMDYSSYTKTTSVSLKDKIDSVFMKGGLQEESNKATQQEFVMSEFIANPDGLSDDLGIVRTQYSGRRSGTDITPTIDGKQIAYTQVFDAELVKFLRPDA